MNGQALGIIETVGFVPAVEASDVAVKTADVSLIGSQAVGGGLVSILMKGDVAAVKASVDAGTQAADRLGEVVSVTVIARTADGLEGILMDPAKRPKCFPEPSPAKAVESEVAPEPEAETEIKFEVEAEVEAQEAVEPAAQVIKVVDAEEGESLAFELADLKKFKVTKLRRLARQLPTFGIARGEIKYAKKGDLLEAFEQYMKTLEK